MAKAEPERKFAVDPAKKKSPQQSQPAAPKKSIRERAAMQARDAENASTEDGAEADQEKEDIAVNEPADTENTAENTADELHEDKEEQ